MNNGPSTASVANLQKFLDTYVCQANTNQTGYFYFEAFDEVWKVSQRWAMCRKWMIKYVYRRTNCMVASKAIGVFSIRSELLSWFILFIQEISPFFSYFSKSLKDITIPTCA